MSKNLICFLILTLVFKISQGQVCGTSNPTSLISLSESQIFNAKLNGPYCIEVVFQIVNHTNGSEAFEKLNDSDIKNAISAMNDFSRQHKIKFQLGGINYINNSELVNIDHNEFDDERINQKISKRYNNNRVINIYVVNKIFGSLLGYILDIDGFASSMPSDSFFIRRQKFNATALSHEMGHCLGLYHTFQGNETPNESDPNACNYKGDLVCDTPPDDGNGNHGDYNPDLTNIMSYYGFTDHFTPGQGERMQTTYFFTDNYDFNSCCEERPEFQITSSAIGPYGQIDINVSGGSPPFKFYLNGNLVKSTYNRNTTLQVNCNGGLLKVKSAGYCSYELIKSVCN